MNAIEHELRDFADACYARDGGRAWLWNGRTIPPLSAVARSFAHRVMLAEMEAGPDSGAAQLAAMAARDWLQRVQGRELEHGAYVPRVAACDPEDLTSAELVDCAVHCMVQAMGDQVTRRFIRVMQQKTRQLVAGFQGKRSQLQ